MSDAGKVLIGTDGNPLLSADGKIVLADDTYPIKAMLKQAAYTSYDRFLAVSSPACASSDIWSNSWDLISSFGHIYFYYTEDGADSLVEQSVSIISLAEYTIDWARVKRVEVSFLLQEPAVIPTGLTVRVTTSKGVTSAPSGTDIRDTWTLLSDYTLTAPSEIVVKWDTNGVDPGELAVAMMVTADTCAIGSQAVYANYYVNNGTTPFFARLIYNLAT